METINKPRIIYYSSFIQGLVYTLPFILFYLAGTIVEALKDQSFPLRENSQLINWFYRHNQDNVMLYFLLMATLMTWVLILYTLQVLLKKYIKDLTY